MDETFAHRHQSTARGITIYQNQILLMERWRDGLHYYSPIGGHYDKLADGSYETSEQVIHRETPEESTVEVEVERKILIAKIGGITHEFFLCNYIGGQPHLPDDAPEALLNDPDNVFRPSWIPIDSLENISLGYWEPIKQTVLDGIANGFPDEPVVIEA